MSTPVTRKLAAIVSTDVVGYSRLMGADEAGTLARMKAHRTELWTPEIEARGGRIVGTAGDSLLVEFASAVAAVECAIAVQRGMRQREADRPENTRMRLRIGVNIGEVVVEGDDIFGDGVNVAARLEALCEPDGIALSDTVHDQVAGKLDVDFADGGAHEVKNITRPVHVWRWSPEDTGAPAPAAAGVAPDSAARAAVAKKPSIAVLAFTNMSGDAEQEYFSDGISEDIITALSKFREFHVIARNSSFTYKGRAVDIKQVGDELGVRYVLEGSVRKAGNRVRITAQLIEASTGNHIWAERYDRELADIFEVQDEITRTIVTAISPAFQSAELRRMRQKRPENLDSWDLTLQAQQRASELTKEGLVRGRELAEQAVALDPHNAQALSTIGWCVGWGISFGQIDDAAAALPVAMAAVDRALELDPTDAVALRTRAGGLMLMRRYDEALEVAQECLRQNENFAHGWGMYAGVLGLTGRFDEAREAYDRALLLAPGDPLMRYWVDWSMGFNAFIAGRHEEGLAYARAAAANRQYGTANVHRLVAAHLAALGRIDEAKDAVARLLELDPEMSLALTRQHLQVLAPEFIDYYVGVLREAGLPEG